MGQSVRDFVAAYEKSSPSEVVRVSDPVSLEYEIMALVLEYEDFVRRAVHANNSGRTPDPTFCAARELKVTRA